MKDKEIQETKEILIYWVVMMVWGLCIIGLLIALYQIYKWIF